MIHEAYMPVYMGSRFLARTDGRDQPKVVQEVLADLKKSPYNIVLFQSKKNHPVTLFCSNLKKILFAEAELEGQRGCEHVVVRARERPRFSMRKR